MIAAVEADLPDRIGIRVIFGQRQAAGRLR
jgi:hypothetical protein